jgi:hypothetical protein
MKSGNIISWNPLGHSRPVTGLLYLLLAIEGMFFRAPKYYAV